MMKRWLLALGLLLFPSVAFAQCNGAFPPGTACGNEKTTSAQPRPVPFASYLTAAVSPLTVYVTTSGTDTGKCPVTAPCATINYAIRAATNLLNTAGLSTSAGNLVTVSVGAGSYQQGIVANGPLPGGFNTAPVPSGGPSPGQILIQGAGSASTTLNGDPGLCGTVVASSGAAIGLSKIKLSSNGSSSSCNSHVFVQWRGMVNIYDDVNFGPAVVEHMHIDDGVSAIQVWCPYTISGGAIYHITAGGGQFINNAFCTVGSKQRFTLGPPSQPAIKTHSNTTVDGFVSTASISPGMGIYGPDISYANDVTVVSVDSSTSITISSPAAGSNTGNTYYFLAPITITGTPAFSGAFAYGDYGGKIQFNPNTNFSGSATGKRFLMHNNSVLVTQGSSSATYLPGNVAGTLDTGAVWTSDPNYNITPPASGVINLNANAVLPTSVNALSNFGVSNLNAGASALSQLFASSNAGTVQLNASSTAAGPNSQLITTIPGTFFIDLNNATGAIQFRTGAGPTLRGSVDTVGLHSANGANCSPGGTPVNLGTAVVVDGIMTHC
jgi:hypothetical protein